MWSLQLKCFVTTLDGNITVRKDDQMKYILFQFIEIKLLYHECVLKLLNSYYSLLPKVVEKFFLDMFDDEF